MWFDYSRELSFVDTNRCLYQSQVCRNGGTCIPGSNGAFQCQCPPTYTGIYCENFGSVSSKSERRMLCKVFL